MTPFWSDDHLTLYGGDCREVLAQLPAESVHCVVTSPPYWGLRDYGTATWEGGDPACDHALPTRRTYTRDDVKEAIVPSVRPGDPGNRVCGRCGARRIDSQLGLEPTPEEYVANMVAVFREVRRVLRADGTLWLNLGDSYAGGGTIGRNDTGPEDIARRAAKYGTGTGAGSAVGNAGTRAPVAGLKPKDLVGIPWRVAFALQADGWYLRSDIIWAKPNPMPESVTDRPTKAHEYLFLLSKSPRYYYDADAVREPFADERMGDPGSGRNADRVAATYGHVQSGLVAAMPHLAERGGRNLRSVWTIATEPYPGAHFATFPRKLVEPCVKAGSPEGGTVLDPFAGSGTTLLVAQALGRRGIGIDLNPDYLRQALARNVQAPLGLAG